MNTIIRTAYHNVNGTPKVLAKGGGKQRTVAWDLSKSTDWNHGTAAGTLALVLFQGETARRIAAEHVTHDQSDDGTKHGFDFHI